jgi:NTE family protein
MKTPKLIRRLLILLIAVGVMGGCAHYPDNPSMASISMASGYRYGVVRKPPQKDKPFVILAFSGGGTRAAAFSFGLMEELRKIEYAAGDGTRQRLLDDVEIISSVSGGSFTSAYYALFPKTFFKDFPKRFLYRNIQGALLLQLWNPYNWVRLASPNFSRIDMASEYYNDTIFQGKRFGNLLKAPQGSVPFLVLNSTDIGINHRFEFTQDQFDLLCSDLSGVAVSRAVAASSCFPVAFPPLTLNDYKINCGPLPQWIDLALKKGQNPTRRYAEAMAEKSYRDPDRRYIHLLDGGLSDNLGLRGPYQAVTTTDSAWSVLKTANLDQLGRLMIIAANAKTTKHRDWDRHSRPPGIGAVLGVVTDGPMDDVSADSVEMTKDHFDYLKQLGNTVDACNQRLQKDCPDSPPIYNPITTDFTFSELSFDEIPDPRLRRCLQELPTSFSLPKETVDLLRNAAAYLLMNADAFVNGMKRLDPTWVPRQVAIDQKLVDDVCPEIPR